MRHLPFYERWFRFLTFYPGAGLSIENSRIDPAYDDGSGLAVSPGNEVTRQLFTSWIESQVGDDPELLAKVMPDYPATGKRTLQDNGSWLACLKRDNVDLVRTPIARIVADGVVTTDGTHYPADVICYATGFRHNDYLWPMTITGRDGRTLRDVWGDEPSAYLGITVPGLPELLLRLRPGHEPRARWLADLPVRVPAPLHPRRDPAACWPTATTRSRCAPMRAAEYHERYRGEIKQMVWSHPSVKHSHFKNPNGEIFTLSPWPIPTYWRWTRAVDPDALRVHVTDLPSVDVRVATADDLAAVLGILDEAAAWLWSQGIRQWPQYFEPQWVLPRLEAGETWLAWSGGEAVGTFTLQWDDTAWSDHHDDDAGYVHRLAVRRGSGGLGRVLLDDAAARVRDAGRHFLRLDCMTANEALRGVLRRSRLRAPRRGRRARRHRPAAPRRRHRRVDQPLRAPSRELRCVSERRMRTLRNAPRLSVAEVGAGVLDDEADVGRAQ